MKTIKSKFYIRVKERLESVELSQATDYKENTSDPNVYEVRLMLSRRSGRSSGSSVSCKRKKGLVELKKIHFCAKKRLKNISFLK